MGWDKLNESTSSAEKVEFTKFAEGITRIRVLQEVPHVRWTHWLPSVSKSVNCPGRGCPICSIIQQQKANGDTDKKYSSQQKFAISIYNYDTARIELLDQGKTFFNDLNICREDYGGEARDVTSFDIRVRRTGMDRSNTTYRLDKVEDATLVLPADAKENAIDLQAYFTQHTVEQITRVLNGEDWNTVMSAEKVDEEAMGNGTPGNEVIELK